MIPRDEDFATRRVLLSAEIARQRGELAQAYQNLAKPIHYAENGMRAFGFLRQNPWVFMAVPSVLSILSTVFGWRKQKAIKPAQQQAAAPKPTGIKGKLTTWGGYAWQLVQLYRRVRPYFL